MANTTYQDFVTNYLVQDGMLGNATNLNKAPDQLKKEIDSNSVDISGKVSKVTSTDNAIVRFDGITGAVQNSGVIIDNNNNIGVGIITPTLTGSADKAVHIHATTESQLHLTNTTTGSTSSDGSVVSVDSSGNLYLYNKENTNTIIGTNNIERMRIDASGNVGIGTSSPATTLSLSKTNDNNIIVFSNGNTFTSGIGYAYTSGQLANSSVQGDFVIRNNGNILFSSNASAIETMRIDTAGNVGIGTSSPNATSKIHAVGSQQSIRIESTIASDAVFRSTTTLGDWGAGTGIGAATNEYSIYNFYNGFKALSIGSTGNINVVTGGLVVSNSNAGLGYGTGAGGTVTQLTSKSTAVTLNKPSGQITMNNAALAAGASVGFYLNNNLISGNQDLLSITTGGASNYDISYSCGTGIAFILIKNKTAGSLSESVVINFAVIKGATA